MTKRARIDDFDLIPTQEMSADQANGHRLATVRGVISGRRKYTMRDVLRSSINHTQQVLTCTTGSTTWKYLVSEYDPHTGGFVSIPKKIYNGTVPSDAEHAQLPMHVYDLNFYCGSKEDNLTNFPAAGTGTNENTNARMWKWSPGNKFIVGAPSGANASICNNVRWRINNPRTAVQDTNNSQYVYRKDIDIKFMLYGCRKMSTKFDVRVIRITKPHMCPDYTANFNEGTAYTDRLQSEFQQGWQNLMTEYTVNPLLRGEPGPNVGRWFTTVAKKTITLGEQTADIEQVPTVQGSIKVNLNRLYNYSWSMNDFTVGTGATNERNYDSALGLDDQTENSPFIHKPYYTSRYYLVIRALVPVDTGTGTNQDEIPGGTAIGTGTFYDKGMGLDADNKLLDYIPSYDLMIKTNWATVNGG